MEVANAPTISELAEKVAAANARRAALQQRSNRIFAVSNPARMHVADPAPSAREVLDAVAERDQVQAQLLVAVADVEDAQRELTAARAADREARIAEIRRQQQPLVEKLDAALRRAAEINDDVAALDALAEQAGATGGHRACHALRATDPFCTPAVEAWRAQVRTLGAL